MSKEKISFAFFGSGPVAAKSLGILNDHFHIEFVVTKSTTKEEMSLAAPGTPVHTVSNKAELDVLITTLDYSSHLAVLIDFGIIVSKKVIGAFPLGIINSHFSLLPELRGADPISFAILNGKRKTGVSLMLIDEIMDTGDLIAQDGLTIAEEDTTPSLTDKLISLSGDMLVKHLPAYISGDLKAYPQPNPEQATYTRKLIKQDGIINWNKPAVEIEREIRAFIGWPKSSTTLGDIDVIVTRASTMSDNDRDNTTPGKIETSCFSDNILAIGTGNGRLCIETLKPAGKKEMSAAAFLAGYSSRLF